MNLIEDYKKNLSVANIHSEIKTLKERIPKIINNNLLAGKYDNKLLKEGLEYLLIYLFMTIDDYNSQEDSENSCYIYINTNDSKIINYFYEIFETNAEEALDLFKTCLEAGEIYSNDLYSFILDNEHIIDYIQEYDDWHYWDVYYLKNEYIQSLIIYLPTFIKNNLNYLIKESMYFSELLEEEKE